MKHQFDVVLIGGGVSGLMAAMKLSDLGLAVALVERHKTLASGPSTRNEGWLHRGTYHSVSIRDRQTAIEVAGRCIYGHKQIRAFAPEAIENDQLPLALLKDESYLPEVLSRWQEADVYHRRVSQAEADKLVPDAAFAPAAAIFQVGEASINTRILYQKMLSRARNAGCAFFLGYEVRSINDKEITITDADANQKILKAEKFVYSAGTGVKGLFSQYHGMDLPLRYWKSHLIITNRLAPMGIFYLDGLEAAMMHHGDVTIVGFNEDAVLCDKPSYDVIDQNVANIEDGLRRIFPSWNDVNSKYVACVKIDLATTPTSDRSLNIALTEPVSGHVIILPGKMTETPYLVDALITHLYSNRHGEEIALRPCDNFNRSGDVLAEA